MANETEGSAGSRATNLLRLSFRDYSAVWLLAFFIVLFSLWAPETFPTKLTFTTILNDQVTIGLVSIAVLIPLTAGAFDLSVGAMLAFGMVITTKLSEQGWNPLLASLVAMVACGVVGWINGFFVVKLRVNSFIATLGMSQLLAAAMLYISKNQQITGAFPSWFQKVTQQDFLGVQLGVWYLFIIGVIVWYVLEHTPVGRSLFAIGGNAEAARLAGVSVGRITWGSLIVSALIAGLAGCMLASKLLLFTGQEGPSYLFPAFAAVFFGATQIKNRPNLWGTLLAMYTLATGVEGLTLTSFENQYWITPAFNGAALLIAVALATQSGAVRVRRGRSRKLGKGSSPSSNTEPEPEASQSAASV
jgi:ribose transport system permease protein